MTLCGLVATLIGSILNSAELNYTECSIYYGKDEIGYES